MDMFTYDELKNDLNIVATYELIDRFDYKPLSLHGLTHVLNVVNIVEKVLKLFGATDEVVNLGKIAAYLHDLGMKDGKKNHAKRSVKEAKKILKHKNLTRSQKNIIYYAIKNHSNCDKQKNLICATLIFADKLDADKTRLGNMGYEVVGLRQCQHIEKIEYDIIGNALVVNFCVNSGFNQTEFESYYHAIKIFKAVKVFADFVGLDFQILLNNEIWKNKNNFKC